MPKVTKKQGAQDVIDQIPPLMADGERAKAEALAREAQERIQACRPQDRDALNEALVEALAAPVSGAGVELASYHDVAGVDELVDQGVAQARKAVDQGMKTADMARTIAETLMEARLKMPNRHSLPDIVADTKFTKNIAHDMFVKAREGVTEEDVDRWATHQSLAKAVRNRMSDVLVARLRSLDENPDAFPADAMTKAQTKFPKLSPTEAVYALYEAAGVKVPRKGRTELAREEARRRAKELEAARQRETPPGEVSDVAAELAAVEKLEASMVQYAHRAEKLPKRDRAKVKARINAVISTLAAEAAKL
ncbi:hypothetical protein OG301_26690 [Streptomyces platensis]|uniref:hypothetical protein n=1 Tax=Streptomyces platensis TaxID=58346 RepID=UPI002ED4926F|nr:hypothetical protein OG301_26690 [Streptomyces platensis]